MRTLRYNFIPIREIRTPFQVRNSTFKKPGSLQETLVRIFPKKAVCFQQKNVNILLILKIPDAPYDPEPDALESILFTNLQSAIVEFRSLYDGLTIIMKKNRRLYGLDETEEMRFIRSTYSEYLDGIELSLVEFHALYHARVNSRRLSGVIVSLFLNPADQFCLWVSHYVQCIAFTIL